MKNLLTRLEALEQIQAARPVYFRFVDCQGNSRRVNAQELEKIARDQCVYILRIREEKNTMPPESCALDIETCYDLRDKILDDLERITDTFTRQRLWFAYHYLKTLCVGFDYRGKGPDGLTHVYYPLYRPFIGGTLLIELTGDYPRDILLDILTEDFTEDILNVDIAGIKYTTNGGDVIIDERFEGQEVSTNG